MFIYGSRSVFYTVFTAQDFANSNGSAARAIWNLGFSEFGVVCLRSPFKIAVTQLAFCSAEIHILSCV